MFNKKIIGLDIGSKNIKLAVMKSVSSTEVISSYSVETPPGSIHEGELKNIEALAATIKQVLRENKIKAQSLAVCINSPHVVIRELSLPNLDDNEIMSAVEFDISKSFSGIVQTHSISFKVYSKDKDGIKGIACICPKKIVEAYVNLSKMLKLQLKYVDVGGNCLAKAFGEFYGKDSKEEAAIIVDIGASSSLVCITANRKILLSRYVYSGGDSVDKLVSSRLAVSIEVAEASKKDGFEKLGLPKEDLEAFVRIGHAALEDQLRQVIDFYRYNKYKEKLTGIFFIGNGSRLVGLAEYFSFVFKMPATAVRMNDDNTAQKWDLTSCMSAVGATIRES